MAKIKYYAVKVGRDGPRIYTSWDITSRYPGAQHKSFKSRKEAEAWLGVLIPPSSPPAEVIDVDLFIEPPGRGLKRRTFHSDSESNLSHEVIDVDDSDDEERQPQRPRMQEHIDLTLDVEESRDTAPQSKAPGSEVAPSVPVAPTLSPQQRQVLDYVSAGKSVFFTGSAGTGKSVLLRAIIEHFGGPDSGRIAITATTGIAAINIGGCTVHSWAGIGIGQESAAAYIKKFRHSGHHDRFVIRWRSTDVLIIDEISMLDGKLFDKLEAIGRGLRGREEPFGGIQLVLCGDFCQLPPVSGKDSKEPATFVFQTGSWKRCISEVMTLTKVFRQKDQEFIDMLNEMRFATMSEATIKKFTSLSRPVQYNDGFEPTELYPIRYQVDKANERRLNQIPGKPVTFVAIDMAGVDSAGKPTKSSRLEGLLEKLLCQKFVHLKVGAQVMLIKNLVQGQLVNGSIGKVVRFATLSEMEPKAPSVNGGPADEKSSGQPRPPDTARAWPVVLFKNGVERHIMPVEFDVTNADGRMEAQRIQIPLILSWALSIHKSQGQTLERVKVDLQHIFEKGQAYVALSRATNLAQLQVINFKPDKVQADERVVQWYEENSQPPAAEDDDDYDEEMDEIPRTQYHSSC